MGDLVLTDEEVNPVMKRLVEGGLEITALHIRPRSARLPRAYRPAKAVTNSSRVVMLIRLMLAPAAERRWGAVYVRQCVLTLIVAQHI